MSHFQTSDVCDMRAKCCKATDLLILLINYIGMIRQKRFLANRISSNQSRASNQHTLDPIFIDKQNLDGRKETARPVRVGLADISSTTNIPANRQSLVLKLITADNKYKPQSKPKSRENIFAKISELIKSEDIPIQICHSNKNKPLISMRERPNSSFCRESKVNDDPSQVNKFSMVLHITKNDDFQWPERTSTSRALMNHSKVYRNGSKQGFRVKKDSSIVNRFVHLSAQKVVFQQKERRQKKQPVEKSFDRSIKRPKVQSKLSDRYQQQQEFQIGGWDYFQ